ncbi:MAG: class I SAM-dependent methyltransferase [Cyclobacteriaceae bacterium]
MATDIELYDFYSNYYDKGNFGLFQYKKIHHEKFQKYQELSLEELKKVFNPVLKYKSGGNFLDIGFGLGEPLFLASKLGFDVSGTELDQDAIEFVKGYIPKAQLRNGDLFDAHFSNQQFDFIRFWHVIEHVRDPVGYVREIGRIMKDDGVLMIGTPNIGCKAYSIHRFLSHWFQKMPTIMDGMDHTVLFTKSRLKELLEQNGFEVVNQFSHGRVEKIFSLFKEPISFKKKIVRLLQSFWDVDQTVYAIKVSSR